MGLENELMMPADTTVAKQVLDRIMDEIMVFLRAIGRLDLATDESMFMMGVRTAIEETLMNNIKHGCQLDPSLSVRVEWEIREDEVVVHSEDPGGGFDPETLDDPTDDENLDVPSGRGVLLTQSFASMFNGAVAYLNEGRRAEMNFFVPAVENLED